MNQLNLSHKEINEIVKKNLIKTFNKYKFDLDNYNKIYEKHKSKLIKIFFNNGYISYSKKKKTREFQYLINNIKSLNKNITIFLINGRYPENKLFHENTKNMILFSFTYSDKYSHENLILIPARFPYTLPKTTKDILNFENKINKCIYRFKNTKIKKNKNERLKLCQIKNNFFNVKCIKNNKEHKMTIDKMREYKYQLDCDGWNAIIWKLNSNSILLRVDNKIKTRTFIDNYIKENEHYIKLPLKLSFLNNFNPKDLKLDENKMIKKANIVGNFFSNKDNLDSYTKKKLESYIIWCN